MKKLLASIGMLSLLGSVPAAAAAQSLEGRWANPKRSVIVDIDRCGQAYCGRVVQASEKAKANARKGGTRNLIGTQVLSGLRPVGNGRYKGKVFVPKRKIYASATVRQVGANVMEVEGCALAGLICDEQRWVRVGS